jgi:hypothetical protein
MPINATWHRQHPMPKRPTLAQRMDWHLEHARECACRPIPAKLEEGIAEGQRRAKPRGKTTATRPRTKPVGRARKRRAGPRRA